MVKLTKDYRTIKQSRCSWYRNISKTQSYLRTKCIQYILCCIHKIKIRLIIKTKETHNCNSIVSPIRAKSSTHSGISSSIPSDNPGVYRSLSIKLYRECSLELLLGYSPLRE